MRCNNLPHLSLDRKNKTVISDYLCAFFHIEILKSWSIVKHYFENDVSSEFYFSIFVKKSINCETLHVEISSAHCAQHRFQWMLTLQYSLQIETKGTFAKYLPEIMYDIQKIISTKLSFESWLMSTIEQVFPHEITHTVLTAQTKTDIYLKVIGTEGKPCETSCALLWALRAFCSCTFYTIICTML